MCYTIRRKTYLRKITVNDSEKLEAIRELFGEYPHIGFDQHPTLHEGNSDNTGMSYSVPFIYDYLENIAEGKRWLHNQVMRILND